MSIRLDADLGLSFQDKQMNLEISVIIQARLFATTNGEDFSTSHHIVFKHIWE